MEGRRGEGVEEACDGGGGSEGGAVGEGCVLGREGRETSLCLGDKGALHGGNDNLV